MYNIRVFQQRKGKKTKIRIQMQIEVIAFVSVNPPGSDNSAIHIFLWDW